MRLYLDIQNNVEEQLDPHISLSSKMLAKAQVSKVIKLTLAQAHRKTSTEMTVRFVDKTEITELNKVYRHKEYATNVLSFPFQMPDSMPIVQLNTAFIGDVVICLQVVLEEALAQDKLFEHHLMHMIIHGTLHLLGFDHEEDAEALEMEILEVAILGQLKVANPYGDS